MYLGAVPDNIKDDNPEALSVYCLDKYSQANMIGYLVDISFFFICFFLF
jgi:hypothetical protein